VEMNFKPFTTH